MGGAGGHMWHPFDCPDVNSGQDLINFFQNSIESIKRNPAALKIDGVNLSFRVRENPGAPSGYEFVVDRGSMKPLDVEGVTADNASERFVLPDGSVHGMVGATSILLGIFNAAIGDILPELKELGMLENIGPFAKYFNTEFVLKKINVKEYPFNFIALHGVSQFAKKGPKSRHGVPADFNQDALERVKDKVRPFASKSDFRVYTSIPAQVKKSVLLDDALNKEFTIVYKTLVQDPEEPGELGAGEGSTKPLKVWLADVKSNPVNKKVNISDRMREIYPSMGKSQTPYAKNIYLEVLKGTAISDIAGGPEDIESIVDAVVVMHATRHLGNAVLDALESEEFGPARDQEGVVVKDPEICGGTSFKFTGDFIVGGLASTFEEAKYKTGRLLESFAVEAGPVHEQRSSGGHVILIPGGFKPPTVGHYSLIKNYEKNSDVIKVYVITGHGDRDGVTYQQSMQIFNTYGGFSDKVEFLESPSNDGGPMRTCFKMLEIDPEKNIKRPVRYPEISEKYSNAVFALGAGDKGKDPDRIRGFANYFATNPDKTYLDIKTSFFEPAEALEVEGKAASASRMRQAFAEGNWDLFKKLMPDDNFYDDVVQILNKQDSGPEMLDQELKENFFLKGPLFSLVDEVISERKMTPSEKRKDTALKKKMDKAGVKQDFIDRYGKEKGKNIYFATIRKNAMAEQNQELEEQEMATGQGREELENVVNNLVRNILKSMPELTNAANLKSKNLNYESDIEGPIIDSILSQLDSLRNKVGSVVTEMSGMAAGAVGGFSGPIGVEEDEEQKSYRRS